MYHRLDEEDMATLMVILFMTAIIVALLYLIAEPVWLCGEIASLEYDNGRYLAIVNASEKYYNVTLEPEQYFDTEEGQGVYFKVRVGRFGGTIWKTELIELNRDGCLREKK